MMQAQQFPLAVIKGDYADPTILRDGDDYYMTHSPFFYKPGFLIWHSTDPGKDKLIERITSREGEKITKYAESLGLGSTDYDLVEL